MHLLQIETVRTLKSLNKDSNKLNWLLVCLFFNTIIVSFHKASIIVILLFAFNFMIYFTLRFRCLKFLFHYYKVVQATNLIILHCKTFFTHQIGIFGLVICLEHDISHRVFKQRWLMLFWQRNELVEKSNVVLRYFEETMLHYIKFCIIIIQVFTVHSL